MVSRCDYGGLHKDHEQRLNNVINVKALVGAVSVIMKSSGTFV